MEKLYAAGKARSIGVSNFDIYQLEELAKISDVVPAVNQIEVHPLWNQSELVSYCQSRGDCCSGICTPGTRSLSGSPGTR